MYKRILLPDERSLLPKELNDVFDAFKKGGFEIYLVGAGVRAILQGQVPTDCDLTTNATPEQIQDVVSEWESFYENIFGTVSISVMGGKEIYEITTYRSEEKYSDFRRPDKVSWGNSLQEDVKRRDFTMNAVVIGRISGKKAGYELLDFMGGVTDFEEGIIKTVGNPNERFGEDALRMMRAVRFATTLDFVIEKDTVLGIQKNAGLLEKISKERVKNELWKILASNRAADGVRLLIDTGLMKYIIPEIIEAKGVLQKGRHKLDVLDHMIESLRFCPATDVLIRFATLLHDIGKPATRRLRCIKCGWVMKEKDFFNKGLECPRCKTTQTEREATTFYGHEVVGARIVVSIADRLRLPKKDKEKAVTLVRWHMFSYQREMTDAAIRRLIRRVGKENINDMMLLRIGDRKGGGSKTTSWRLMELQKRIGEQLYEPMEIRDLAINGKDVMKILGIKPGPKVGKIMKALFEEVIEDTSKNTKKYLTEKVGTIE